jgi:asparagine synthase (glutamine-hydrolysing)
MAYSLEARVPFLDVRAIEYGLSLPPRLKLWGLQEKYILRRAMRDHLPPSILARRKHALTPPVDHWFDHVLPPFVDEMLSPARICEKGYFNADTVTSIFRAHRNGTQRFGKVLLGILGVQLWDEIFVQKRSPEAFADRN